MKHLVVLKNSSAKLDEEAKRNGRVFVMKGMEAASM